MRFLYRLLGWICGVLTLASIPLSAGIKYEQTTQVSGSMIEMMKKMPLVGKRFGGDMSQTHFFTSDSMRSDSFANGKATQSEIILLGAEKFIHIDHEKKTYTETTFEEMRAKLEKAMQEMRKAKKEDAEVTITPKISVKETGESKVINGYDTKQFILTMSMEIRDKNNDQKAGSMEIVSDLWITKDIPGYEEQRRFYLKMAEKMGSLGFYREAAGVMAGMMQDPKMAQGMAEMKREMAKMEGTPVLAISSIIMPGMPAGAAPPPSQGGQSQSQTAPETPSIQEAAKESAKESAAGAVNKNLGKVFGGLGGFGGLSRKKKKAEQPVEEAPATPPAQSAPEPAPQNAPAASASSEPFMRTTTEMKSFEKLSLSSDTFQVPAGYKLVQEK